MKALSAHVQSFIFFTFEQQGPVKTCHYYVRTGSNGMPFLNNFLTANVFQDIYSDHVAKFP